MPAKISPAEWSFRLKIDCAGAFRHVNSTSKAPGACRRNGAKRAKAGQSSNAIVYNAVFASGCAGPPLGQP
jgi:hypothetical protein